MNCGNLTSGDAQCDACQTSKCCNEAAACSNNAACGDILDCLNTNNCTTQACFTMCENQYPAGKASEQAFFSCMSSKCSAACQ